MDIDRQRSALRCGLFERLLSVRNDVGLLNEERDTEHHRQLGNTPQAFTMVGSINTARHLAGTQTTTSARRHQRGLNHVAG
jgi:GH15 family glucan-1,4-alpha-glucosidase